MERRLRLVALAILLLLLCVSAAYGAPPAAQSASAAQPPLPSGQFKVWLQAPHALGSRFQGMSASAQALNAGAGAPLALAAGDFDADGVQDLVVGYATGSGGALALYRGNLDAFAPQSQASFEAIGRGQFPDPFLPDAQVMDVAMRPDFLAIGDLNGDGYLDVIIGSRSSSTLLVLFGDGAGHFTQPYALALPGSVTALASERLLTNSTLAEVLVGTGGPKPQLLVFVGTKLLMGFSMPGAVTSLAFGHLYRDAASDTALVAGGQLMILQGQDLRSAAAGSFNFRLAPVGLPLSALAVAVGSFLPDRDPRQQIAVLSTDGSVQIVARSGFDPRPLTPDDVQALFQSGPRGLGRQNRVAPNPTAAPENWKIVEGFPSVATVTPGQAPLFFRTRISSNAADDIMWLGASSTQMVVISHPDAPPGATTFVAGEISVKPYDGTAVAGVPLRVNVDGRPGIVALHQGQTAPSMSMPLPDPTFTVNRTDDPTPVSPISNACNGVANDCSLREAILKANSIAGTDTVMVPAGTYTLTIAKVANDCTGNFGALSVNDSLNIIGAGQNTTIIQAGTTAYNAGTPNGVDMVMNVNEDLGTANCPLTNATASISNLTLQNGHNRGTAGFDGDGGCMEFDTGTSGTANLTLTSVTLQNCDAPVGNGGGLAAFNFTNPGSGFVTVTNGLVQGNNAGQGVAGGIWASVGSDPNNTPTRLDMSGSQVLNNKAQVSGTGEGGGIWQKGVATATQRTHIQSSTISGNQAGGDGGGILTFTGILIDQGTVISNNSAGLSNTANQQEGGGVFVSLAPNQTLDISKVTITGNSSTGFGGGIDVGDAPNQTINVTFSRIAGNTAPSGSNMFVDATQLNPPVSPNVAVVVATNDWWGTDAPATVIGIQPTTAGPPAATQANVTFDPFIVLTHHASPNPIQINHSSTLTADMSKDNHGNGAALSGNLDEIVGLPVTFGNTTLGTIPQAQPEALGTPVPTATATFNAGGTGGRETTTSATVDQAVVGVESNLIASASESGTTATITTVGAHNFSAGQSVIIAGVGVSGYNGTFTITSVSPPTQFSYTAGASGLGSSSGGTATVGLIILEPPSIVKSFNPTTVATNTPSTVAFSITNGNVMAIDNGFTDVLPTGLVVAATPSVVNTCGGTVTATAGSGTISFANATFPANTTCSVQVNVESATDKIYSNSVTIVSTLAGNGNTSSANLTVINPPTIAKAFGAATIPLNGTTSLTFTVSNTNVNSALNGITFTDSLPAGLVVAPTPNLNNTCSGTATAVAGASSVSLATSSLAPGASCTVSVDVQGTAAGVKNNSVTVSDTTAGTGNTSNASLTVVGPPTISKAFGAASIPLNGSTSLSFTIQNPSTTVALSGVAFSDTLPANLIISTPNGLTGSCGGGTITATQATNVISLSGGTIAASSSCTFSVNVTGTAAGDALNTTGAVTSTEGGTGTTSNTATVSVVAPPSIAKAFNPSTIALNATTSLTFTITNPAANTVSLTGVAFTDTLPTGLTVANASATVCGGTLTTTAPTGISLSGASIAVNSQCVFSVTVTAASSGQYTNTTGNVTSTNGGTGNTASANLTVAAPPTITKVFGAASVPLNGTTSLTFTINNPNTGVTLNGIAFTDNLPAGLVIAATPNLNNTCGGTATAVGGASSLSLSAGTLAASASCTVSVDVQGTTAGVKNNSVQVTSTEGGTGNTSNASITVVGPPVIIKAFGAASIPLNGSTSLSFTIQNNNTTTTLTGVGFSDTLPAGLVISTPNGLTGSCGGGTITATQATNVISLSGASIAASSSCTFSVNVTGVAAGLQNNTTGNVTSTEGGTGGTASASVKVEAPPSIAKSFNPATIALNATTSLTFTITNPAANVDVLTGVAFTDTLPTGLTVANASATVCGGTLTTTAPTGIALSGASIAVNSQCVFSVTVTGAASGQYTNTTGAVTSTNGGTGNTASANLTVASPPTITKAFGAASIPLNGTTSLTFSLSNPNTNVTLTGIAFTDNLPAGLVIAATPNLNNTCGGTATAVGGASSVSLSGATLATTASCTVSVDVQGTTGGVKNNSVQATSTEGGTGNTSNASITVIGPPAIIKAFGAASIPLNGSTSLSFTIQNNNTTQSLSGIGFSDTLPAGLVISTPNGLTGSCGGGTITATQATNVISLSGASLAASSSCTFSINVTGTAAGTQNNTTGNVTSTEGGTGNTASASVNVEAPPSIAKAFNPAAIAVNATTSLTFTITNPAANAVALTGVAFTDTLPTGLTVANASATVCGGTLTTTAPTGIALSGATIAANSQCVFSVTVTGAAAGQYTNTTGAVTSTNGGTGNTASANLSVAQPPTISKAFSATAVAQNGTTFVFFTISNPNASVDLTGLAFTDTLPAGLVVANPNGLSDNCGGTVTATPGSSSISLSGGALTVATGTCTIVVKLQVTGTGTLSNTTGPVSATESGPGSPSNTATLDVVAAPTLAKAFGAASIALNASTSLTFTITNPNPGVSLVNLGFTDLLPSGLVVSNPNGLTGSCVAISSITANAGSNSISMASLVLPPSGTCSFAVNVTGVLGGVQNNTTSQISGTFDDGSGTFIGITGGTASASVTVTEAPPTIAKAFGAASIPVSTATTLSFAIHNPNPAPLSGIAFSDTLPAGLVVASPNGLANSCGGAVSAAAGSGSVSLTGGTLAASASCSITVNVTAATTGSFSNTTGVITATESGPGTTSNTALLTVSDFSIAASPSSQTVTAGGSAAYTVTVTPNPAPFGQPVTLAVTGLPLNTVATLVPNPIPGPINAPTNSTLTIITSPRNAALTQPASPFGTRSRTELAMAFSLGSFGLLGMVFVGVGGGRRRKRLLWVLLGMLLLGALLAGCGGTVTPGPHGGGGGTPAGTYTITITGTASGTSGGSLSHSTTVTLVVN